MPEQYTIDDLFDPRSPVSLGVPTFTSPGAPNAFSEQVDPAQLTAGEIQGNTTVQDGYLQSSNYVPDTSGWRLSPTGADINGGVAVDSLDIPDTTTANSFHVDTDGNTWWGATAFADAIASISKAGEAIFKSYSLQSQFTAGEALSKGTLACLMNSLVTWGNQTSSSTNQSTTAILSAFTYVDGANPTTAEGANLNTVKLGQASNLFYIYGKLDLTSSNPGLPAWYEIESIKLRIYVTSAAGAAFTPTLSRLTASFTESTVTYNTRPADDGVTWASASVATPTANAEICASTADLTSTGYIEFDITELYRHWSLGTFTNNGFVIHGSGTGNATIGGRSRTDISAFNQAPFVLAVITKDNPGQGTSFVASDGKAYVAKHSDYQRVKNIIGIVGANTSSGATAPIFTLADKSVIPSSILSVVNGANYYLSDDSGTLSTLTNDIIETGYYDRKIGVGTPNGLSVELDKSPVLIKQVPVVTTGLLPPPNARYATISFKSTVSGNDYYGVLHLEKSFFTDAIHTVSSGVTKTDVGATWASGTSGLLTFSNITTGTVNWYR